MAYVPTDEEIRGSEIAIIQTFAANPDEVECRMGFLLYCMEVAMGFKKMYFELTGGVAPPGLSRANLDGHANRAWDHITVNEIRGYSRVVNPIIHPDVQTLLGIIRPAIAANLDALRVMTVDRDRVQGLYDALRPAIETAVRVAGENLVRDLAAKDAERGLAVVAGVAASDAAHAAEMAAKNAELALANQRVIDSGLLLATANRELDILRAVQPLNAKFDIVKARFDELSRTELALMTDLQASDIRNPDTKNRIDAYMLRDSNWARAGGGASAEELDRLRPEMAAIRAELAAANLELADLRRTGTPEQIEAIRLLTVEVAAKADRITALQAEVAAAAAGAGGGDLAQNLDLYLAQIPTAKAELEKLRHFDRNAVKNMRERSNTDALEGLNVASKNTLKHVFSLVIDRGLLALSTAEIKTNIEKKGIRRWVAASEWTGCIGDDTLKSASEDTFKALTGMADTASLTSTLDFMANVSTYSWKKEFIVVAEQCADGYGNHVFRCKFEDEDIESEEDDVDDGDTQLTFAEDVIAFLIKQYILLSSHILVFDAAFSEPSAEQAGNLPMLLEYFRISSNGLLSMSKDCACGERATNLGKYLMTERLTSGPVAELPLLLMMCAYPIHIIDGDFAIGIKFSDGGDDDEGIQTALSEAATALLNGGIAGVDESRLLPYKTTLNPAVGGGGGAAAAAGGGGDGGAAPARGRGVRGRARGRGGT